MSPGREGFVRFSQLPQTPLDHHDRGEKNLQWPLWKRKFQQCWFTSHHPPLCILSPTLRTRRPSLGCSTPATTTTLDWATCIIEEEIPQEVRHEETLPPPSTALDQGPRSTCSLSPEHLDLIFEMRRDMQEQLHRHTLLSSRLDLLFDTLSETPGQRRCPTCAQSFIFTPVGNTHGGKGFTVLLQLNLAQSFCFLHYKCQNVVGILISMIRASLKLLQYVQTETLSVACSVSICLAEHVAVFFCNCPGIKSCSHLSRFPFVWQNRWLVFRHCPTMYGCEGMMR
jgi:hypothetical protein